MRGVACKFQDQYCTADEGLQIFCAHEKKILFLMKYLAQEPRLADLMLGGSSIHFLSS